MTSRTLEIAARIMRLCEEGKNPEWEFQRPASKEWERGEGGPEVAHRLKYGCDIRMHDAHNHLRDAAAAGKRIRVIHPEFGVCEWYLYGPDEFFSFPVSYYEIEDKSEDKLSNNKIKRVELTAADIPFGSRFRFAEHPTCGVSFAGSVFDHGVMILFSDGPVFYDWAAMFRCEMSTTGAIWTPCYKEIAI